MYVAYHFHLTCHTQPCFKHVTVFIHNSWIRKHIVSWIWCNLNFVLLVCSYWLPVCVSAVNTNQCILSKILSHVYCISIIFYVNFNRIKQCFPITIGFDNNFFGVCVCLYIDVMNFLLSFWMAAACKTVYRFVNRSVRKDLMNSWMYWIQGWSGFDVKICT